ATSSVVVALQTDIFNSNREVAPTTTSSSPPAGEHVSLTLSPSSAKPGQLVVVTGRLTKPLAQKQSFATLCWDGCGGLQEQGVGIHWRTSTSFRMTLRVPESPWLESTNSSVTIHPLTSGKYEVGVQCVTSISGCALRNAEAQTLIQLKAPAATRCLRREQCATMTLSSSSATVGEEVLVKGWAPLQAIIGRPESYSLSLTSASAASNYPELSYTPLIKVGGFNIELTPRSVRVEPTTTWADLGHVNVVSSTFSGASAISPVVASNLVAWCQPSDIVITGGAELVHVPIAGARAALKGTALKMFTNPPFVPPCSEVQLDPRYPDTVYAGFGAEHGNSIPPVYLAPLYTTNDGATWHVVPLPSGMSIEDFGGFSSAGEGVSALFSFSESYNNRVAPIETEHGLAITETTTNGGSTWVQSSLGCPLDGPCATFGPFQWGNCAMSYDYQPVLLGPPGAAQAAGVKWTDSDWVTTVNSCYSQQLVVSSAHELFFLDPSSQYPLLRSTDGGLVWAYVALPANTANYNPDYTPNSNSLVLAPGGVIFNSVPSRSGLSQVLYRLGPLATSWCEVPHVFGSTLASSGAVGILSVNRSELLWTQKLTSTSNHTTSSMHVRKLSSLTC
ncbi:MAG TPA: hypothetical protein VGP11_06465, partial [Acidimicrobiales bacterium]|nr:hypothetical protein [Acidimicrobiales bacterium]